jgi:tetratricopeptide (TPR) repeat protein
MTTKHRPRFDIAALRELAGDKVFARGEAYHRDGQVVLLSINTERVVAQVSGTEDYRTVLTGRGKEIDGECSCRAFEDWGFCKHMVAVALAANAAGNDSEADGAGALGRIRAHLRGKGVDALVEMVVELAERDPALFRKLELATATVDADDKTLERRLGKAIDAATRIGDYIDYRQVRDWAKGVDATLDPLGELASGDRACLALKLTERAIDRIEQAVGSIDDSDGYCGALLNRARDIHLAAAVAARPDPVALARDLFAREMDEGYDTFYRAAQVYSAVLGKKGLAEYRRLAAEAWAKLPPRSGKSRATGELLGDYDRLKDMLDGFAEGDGDVEARIALRTKDLSSPWKYLELAEFCCAQGRNEEALRHAEEGLWVFEDQEPDERLVLFAAELLAKAGRKSDAEARLWRGFEKEPSLELYTRLRKLGGKAACERAIGFLEPRLARKNPTRWHGAGDLLISILMQEKLFDAAWASIGRHGASTGTKETLARASEATHPREAVNVYAEHVAQLAAVGGNQAYAEAKKLIGRMAGLRSAAEHGTYLAELKTRFGRKRNFMKLLE